MNITKLFTNISDILKNNDSFYHLQIPATHTSAFAINLIITNNKIEFSVLEKLRQEKGKLSFNMLE